MVLGYMGHVILSAVNRQWLMFFPRQTTAHIDIQSSRNLYRCMMEIWQKLRMADAGKLGRRYGEPEDIFPITRNGRLNEEWKYWNKGSQFSLES